jgi:hypothetical protein
MKTRFINFFLTLVVLGGGYTITQAVSANQPVKVAKSVWKLFSPPDGGFRILMPGKPRETKQTVNTKSGNIKLNMFTVKRQQEEVTYTVGYVDYSSEYIELLNRKNLVQKALDSGRNNVVKKSKGSLISERKIRLGSYFGREISYSKPGGNIVRQRIYLVEKRLYQVTVETTKKREKFLTKSMEGFLNSFNVSSR